MLDSVKKKRYERRVATLEKRCEKLAEANDTLKDEKAELERELVVARAKLDRTGKYEEELREVLAQARDAKRSYEAAYHDLQIVRRQYTDEVSRLIAEIKGE